MRLIRNQKLPSGIFSSLIRDDGSTVCVTAEHSYEGVPKLLPGRYTCVRGTHRLHNDIPFETFEIVGVPGHTGILFHIGNFPQIDSDGCVLVGKSIAGETITSSREAFKNFMTLMDGINEFPLEVV